MANQKQPKSRPAPKSGGQSRRPRRKKRSPLLMNIRLPQRPRAEFREDAQGSSFLKIIRFTQLQRLQLVRWGLYCAVCVLCLVIQDTIMSRITLLGATTDLAVSAMLVITVLEGSEIGSIFILLASLVYYFSGSAPGPYSVGLLTVLGLLATLFRQNLLHRSPGAIIVCAGLTAVVYEMGLYGVGLFLGLTRWYRFGVFLLTGIYTAAAMIPLYYLIYRIGLIGGYTWKE